MELALGKEVSRVYTAAFQTNPSHASLSPQYRSRSAHC